MTHGPILFHLKEHLYLDTKVGEKFKYMDGSKSPGEFPQTPPEFEDSLINGGGGLLLS